MGTKRREGRASICDLIAVAINIDGSGELKIKGKLLKPFIENIMTLFAKGDCLFDLTIINKMGYDSNLYQTIIKTGECLGLAFNEALGEKEQVARYGDAAIVVEDVKAEVSVDLSDRSYLVFNTQIDSFADKNYKFQLLRIFLQAFIAKARITVHINSFHGNN